MPQSWRQPIARSPIIVWFTQDLRVNDHRALSAAAASDAPVIPLYVHDERAGVAWPPGAAARWWLNGSLAALDEALRLRDSRLILRRGETVAVLRSIAEQTGARTVYCTRRYDPRAILRETTVMRDLGRLGIRCRRFTGGLLFEPEEVLKPDGGPYRLFSAFVRACANAPDPGEPLPAPRALRPPPDDLASDELEELGLLPQDADWAAGLRDLWTPGEASARERFATFLHGAIANYDSDRDRPDLDGTSRLSPHLHWGEISVRACWHAARLLADGEGAAAAGAESFLRQLMWREFSHHLLFHIPSLPDLPLRPEFADFPWLREEALLAAWRQGMTGYPIVDAGMRELAQTGYMHGRVRMIAASFLVKHLLCPWQEGEAWFWERLLDADLANNAVNWQWVAGSGTDAAPYFRIFNPVLQGRKFDPEGNYVRRFVPELGRLPAKLVHAPWEAGDSALAAAGVVLGETYPRPIVDHRSARTRALAAFEAMKAGTRGAVR